MKLMLGTTELAEIPDDVAAQLITIFQRPGYLAKMPETSPIQRPESFTQQLSGSHLAQDVSRSTITVSLELTAVHDHTGPLFDTRARDRMRGQ